MKKEIEITGMKCSGCESHLQKVLLEINGVKSAIVSKDKNNAVIECDSTVTNEIIKQNILNNTHFNLVNIKNI